MANKLTLRVKKIWAQLALVSIELLLLLVLFFISVLGFAYLVNKIFKLKKSGMDNRVFNFMELYTTPENTAMMKFVTFFGTHLFLIPANLLLIGDFLFVRKHRWYSIKVPVVAIGSVVVMSLLKLYFSRARPLTPILQEVQGFSFPSGHAMSAVTFYGLLIYLVYRYIQGFIPKTVLIGFLALFILLIGISRIYLRVHYTSDVLAGFAMGIIWLVLSLWVMGKIEKFTQREVRLQPPTTSLTQ
jgi:membrane-associated phospholipid phosphatase